MKLYGHPMSTCTRKVLATLAEKGVTPDLHVVDIMSGAGKSAENLARQPFGQIPSIDDDGFKLFESRAIIRYLDQKLDGAALTPKDPKERASMEQWISIETSNFTPHAMTLLYQLFFGPMRGQPVDQAKVDEGRAKLAKCVDVLEKHLASSGTGEGGTGEGGTGEGGTGEGGTGEGGTGQGGPFLLGDTFTLADICFAPYIEYLVKTPAADVILSQPHVAAWWTKISERPSWKKAIGQA